MIAVPAAGVSLLHKQKPHILGKLTVYISVYSEQDSLHLEQTAPSRALQSSLLPVPAYSQLFSLTGGLVLASLCNIQKYSGNQQALHIPKLSCKQWMAKATTLTGSQGSALTIQIAKCPNRKKASAQLDGGEAHTQTHLVVHVTANHTAMPASSPVEAEQGIRLPSKQLQSPIMSCNCKTENVGECKTTWKRAFTCD